MEVAFIKYTSIIIIITSQIKTLLYSFDRVTKGSEEARTIGKRKGGGGVRDTFSVVKI